MARRLLGTAVTDENGEATIEYTGTGAGELHIVAESGTFSSNVITIDDYDPIIDSATITSDKNIIQSGESANLTVIGKDKHNELVNEDTFDLCEQFIVSRVSVDSTGIVQSGSNLDIKAKVNTSLGGVPNNVPVVFKKGDETLDTVQTSASGVATYPYPGTGIGEVNITAECDGVVSKTYEVLDCLVYDDGISDPKKTTFIKSANGTVTIGSDGTTLNSSATTSYRNTTLITGDFEAVFQASLSGSIRIGVQTSSELGYKQSKFNYYNVSDYYFKLKRVGSTVTAQYSADGVNWTNRSLETDNVADNDCYFIFIIETSGTERSITYKDLKIYLI